MSSTVARVLPPDQAARVRALDATRSVLVQAPAGSGKTDLLTRRFLRLLGEVDEPGEIVAITFTRAAAAEMRYRILAELENAAAQHAAHEGAELDEFSMESLAARALARSQARRWNLIDLPAELRISTIDSFCRELAFERPLLSDLGGGLDIFAQPGELYRRAARHALEQIDAANPEVRAAIEELLLWRDNGWQEMEGLLVTMLAQRDRWMQGFVLEREQDWERVRERMERPFANAVRGKIQELNALLDQVPRARAEALELARFGCEQTAGALHRELAEMAEFPLAPFSSAEQLEEARQACVCLAQMVLTKDGEFRQRIDKSLGFPAGGMEEKARLSSLIADLRETSGLKAALAAVVNLPPARYPDEDWLIVRACFTLLRHAAGELKVVFAEQGAADYVEVAQTALRVLRGDDGRPGDAALSIADGIRHLLVDEFQDTSRRQYELMARLVAAWPESEGRTCFVVGDPMQSIYFFRDADAELFQRVRDNGIEIPDEQPLTFDSVGLRANFRTAPSLVNELKEVFAKVFAEDDGSGVTLADSEAARKEESSGGPQLVRDVQTRMKLHLSFMPQRTGRQYSGFALAEEKQRVAEEREAALTVQVDEIVALIRGHWPAVEAARADRKLYRIAILGRTRKALAPVAAALRDAGIPIAAVDLEELKQRPEVLDALALVRALLNPHDRVAWLGVLRAPWCGLSLADLHTLASADDPELQARPVPALLAERGPLLSEQGRAAVQRMLQAAQSAEAMRAAQPAAGLGTRMEQAWLRLGGAACVDAAGRANLDLLWKCLDDLPEGEQGVFGSALDAALDKLTALPDPAADSNCGVQLMTIHKAKGLEFEVVIVPEIQAGARRARSDLLSWMERGLTEPDESGAVTEFLVAPIPSKGADRGQAKAWVDQIRREREGQEMRRLLYVGMTRAREELHLFARPAYKTEANGSLTLIDPKDCLLATAWPAFAEEIRRQFEQWSAGSAPATVEKIAAAGETPRGKATMVRRLPADFQIVRGGAEPGSAPPIVPGADAGQLYRRHEGGLQSRALGIAVHTLLQELARLRTAHPWEAARAALAQMEPRIVSGVRATGIDYGQAGRIAARAVEIALRASQDPIGQWILSPHRAAVSEARWAGVMDGAVHAVQVDRVFRAGAQPGSAGDEAWWIVDYKTAHSEGLDPQGALPELRRLFAPQLEAYARILRNLHGADARVCAGLYYPRMMQFDWWEM